MASKKIRDIVVKVGEYQDRNTGETKGRFENVGALMQGDDNSYFIMLKRTFNPAGVPGQDARESILLGCYIPQDQRQSGPASHVAMPPGYEGTAPADADRRRADLDDEIPF